MQRWIEFDNILVLNNSTEINQWVRSLDSWWQTSRRRASPVSDSVWIRTDLLRGRPQHLVVKIIVDLSQQQENISYIAQERKQASIPRCDSSRPACHDDLWASTSISISLFRSCLQIDAHSLPISRRWRGGRGRRWSYLYCHCDEDCSCRVVVKGKILCLLLHIMMRSLFLVYPRAWEQLQPVSEWFRTAAGSGIERESPISSKTRRKALWP